MKIMTIQDVIIPDYAYIKGKTIIEDPTMVFATENIVFTDEFLLPTKNDFLVSKIY